MANNDVLRRVEEIVDSYGCRREHLIAIMQDIQNEYKYLSTEALELVADKLDIGVAKVYSVATFYENFSLEAKGKYIIKVCCGTACHVRKSQPIYDGLREYLKLSGKQKTSSDGLFTLETVACLGACGLSPVLTVNDEVYPKMTPESAIELLESLRAKEGKSNGKA
ncbi:MAG: NAD(P)H-dependent oxidoreductase subunit E [Ruminococcaceae bacterium]|nr:NAD(P)H-dependent oxidoreductase subunit E [Oscillospiraceae bacterium]